MGAEVCLDITKCRPADFGKASAMATTVGSGNELEILRHAEDPYTVIHIADK